MSLKKRKPTVAFSWHKSFAILAPWRKGKGDMTLENEVVLTKMKFFNNVHEKPLNAEDTLSTVSMSMSEQDISAPLQAEEAISVHSAPPETNMEDSKKDYLSVIFSDSKLPILYKFESEDSGVEMPSGANSPSTPTGSEQSFVVHSRESSCDSGTLNPPIPSTSPILLLEQSTDSLETEQTSCMYDQEDNLMLLEDRPKDQTDSVLLESSGDSERAENGTLGNISEIHVDGLVCGDTAEERAEGEAAEDTESSNHSIEAYDGNMGAELQQQPLRKSTTSDSLDEYMEECCRLSEVNQAQSNPLGSGLGYLEHICQLIEKIGQLQEHNLKLQKQICNLQKDSKMMKTKEDFFVQHCHCGAAGLAFQELKRYSRSDYHSLAASNGTLSDLTTIPEGTRIPHRSVLRDGEGGCQSVVPMWRRGLNRRSYTEGEARYLSDSAEALSAPHRRLENYTWGRVKDLVKKTRLRNQSRLGLSSGSLKRSCPQLYRPELGPVELSRRDRNSMIILGHQKLDYHWPH
ncbi:uncharacterized protein si:ch211-250c4.3 [Pygocentrus nattereri]|uniref:uncharacterized protein si:ch211-250c4.3 n=1 Tax=Pygocentrus nattereri TaxID=42514 RepID=UPI00081445BA|nr:uncharacterized protein si:ch211-250c4.3 [Pygocentrus nattereri]